MDMAKVMEYMEEMDSNWLDLMQLCLHEADGERALAAYILLGLSVNQSSGDIPKDATDRLLAGLRTRLRSRFGQAMQDVIVDV